MSTGRLVDAGGVAVLCAVALLSAVLEVLLIPLRVGAVMIPVTIVFAVAGAAILPRLACAFVDTTGAMAVTFLFWLLPMLALSLLARPEGDVLVRGGGGEQWVFYGLLLGGGVTGTATIVLRGNPRRPVAPPPPARVRPRPKAQR